MKRHPFASAFLALLLALTACLPAASTHAETGAPPPRSWEARRHPDAPLDALQPGAAAAPAQGDAALAGPDWLPYDQWSRIAFQSGRDGNWEIYTALPSGQDNPQRLTNHPKLDMRPRLDPVAQRVAWVSDRDGNYEIYSANADGSNQRRLTDQIWEDDDPDWSPDGARIAFASRRDGDWDIYTMAADGSDVRQVTNLPGDDWGPTWSPGGSEIAWIHAGATTGDILVARADGSAVRAWAAKLAYPGRLDWSPDGEAIALDAIVDESGWSKVIKINRQGEAAVLAAWYTADVWMGSFSPDGSQILTTVVQYRVAGSQYAIESIRLMRMELTYYPMNYFLPGYLDAYPDWKSIDNTPPQSRLDPLPPFSRNHAWLNWSGSDRDGVGIDRFELRDETVGGGVRELTLSADSGLEVYGAPGETHRYSLRAIDNAGNKEPWGRAVAQTTYYNWGLNGVAAGVRGRPLSGVTASVDGALAAFPSGPNGVYRTYAAHPYTPADVSWQSKGWLPLPKTLLPTQGEDAAFDVVLPSPDNVVANWGFEGGGLAGWDGRGDPAPAPADASHTGQVAARLGPELLLGPSHSLTFTLPYPVFDIGADAAGRAYLAVGSSYGGEELRLVVIGKDGAVESVEQPEPDGLAGGRPDISVSPEGVVDIIYARLSQAGSGTELRHRRRSAGGQWSDAFVTSLFDFYSPRGLATGPDGVVHIVAAQRLGSNTALVYLRRAPDGAWDAPVKVAEIPAAGLHRAQLAVDALGRVHVVWSALRGIDNQWELRYRRRDAAGTWAASELIGETGITVNNFSLALGGDGRPRVLWLPVRDKTTLAYAVRDEAAGWTQRTLETNPTGDVALAVDEADFVHALWSRVDGVAYWREAADGNPAGAAFFVSPGSNVSALRLSAAGGNAVFAYPVMSEGGYTVLLRQATQGAAGALREVGLASPMGAFDLVARPGAAPVIAWRAERGSDLRYLQPPAAPSAGESTLSQRVAIPADMPAPTLSLMLSVGKPWADGRGRFEARVRDAGGKVTLLGAEPVETAGYVHRWYDLTPWQGQTVTVELAAITEAGGPLVGATIDEVTVSSGLHADTWVEPVLGGIPAGRTGSLTLLYGNRGDFDAADATLRLSLPAGVTLTAANPPAQADGGAYLWHPGALPAGATGRIEVTLRNDTASGDPGPLTATITPGPGEINTADNDVSAMVWGRMRVLLPRVGR